MTGSVIVITGVMAAGKSTVAQRLAERLPRSAHIRGDVFRRMIVGGRVEPTPEEASATPEAGSARPEAGSARPEAGSARPEAGSARPEAGSARPEGGSAGAALEESAEAQAQLRLRYELSAAVADRYAEAGFTAIVQDVILGPDLSAYRELVRTRPCHLIVLCPRPEVVVAREAGRRKTGYGDWTVEGLDRELRATARIGLWLDNSDQTPDETVEDILAGVTVAPASNGPMV
jgi:chloramphenicol 3-O-phosphotransferase